MPAKSAGSTKQVSTSNLKGNTSKENIRERLQHFQVVDAGNEDFTLDCIYSSIELRLEFDLSDEVQFDLDGIIDHSIWASSQENNQITSLFKILEEATNNGWKCSIKKNGEFRTDNNIIMLMTDLTYYNLKPESAEEALFDDIESGPASPDKNKSAKKKKRVAETSSKTSKASQKQLHATTPDEGKTSSKNKPSLKSSQKNDIANILQISLWITSLRSPSEEMLVSWGHSIRLEENKVTKGWGMVKVKFQC